jgi:hypothetical protein
VLATETDVIELPERFFPNHVVVPSHVFVQALCCVENAETIRLQPLSLTDWKLLEQYAAQLEGGNLLQQVSIVYPKQSISLHVGGASSPSALARVLTADFELLDDNNTMWPVDPHTNRERCLRLVANTEVVIVSPVTIPPETTPDLLLRLVPCLEEYSDAMPNLVSKAHIQPDWGQASCASLSLLPHMVAVHPRTLSRTRGWSDKLVAPVLLQVAVMTPGDDSTAVLAIAMAITSTKVPEDCVGRFCCFVILRVYILTVCDEQNHANSERSRST